MTAILFGSIGSLADTSELQRAAFNEAFARHGLEWNWSQEEYRELLAGSGGAQRIDEYAQARGETVDADAVHATKSEIFQNRLRQGGIEPRPGVVETIAAAGRDGSAVALVTTTSPENVAALAGALAPEVDVDAFALHVDTSSVTDRKPAPDAYAYALAQLGEHADQVVAIEDNVGGVESADAAGIACVAFPGQNNAGHDFSAAAAEVDVLSYEQLRALIGDGAGA